MLGVVRKGTSFGEASSRTQATDPNRRETLRIRTPLPGLRGEAKWLRKLDLSHGHSVRQTRSATPWSAKALTREVTGAAFLGAAEEHASSVVPYVKARASAPA